VQIECRPLSEIKPYPKNARRIPQAAIDAVAKSIQEFGWRQPIVVDKESVIVVGHVRLKAAYQLGLEEAHVHVALDLTPAQIRAYRLMDNRSNDYASFDIDLLGEEMRELAKLDLDLSLTGFEQSEIDSFLAMPDEERANATPPVPDPVSRPGDLWLCGTHRVLCGDATSHEVVRRLLNERKPILLVTDPPYGVELDSEWRDRAGINSTDRPKPLYEEQNRRPHPDHHLWRHRSGLVSCV
jgi:hypothetical protein